MYPNNAGNLASLEEQLREAAALLLQHAEGLTTEQRQFLYDVGRRDGRSRFKSVATMLDIAARCEDVSVRYFLPEVMRGQIVSAEPAKPVCIASAFLEETIAEGAANAAQIEHLTARSAPTADGAIRALTGHGAAIRFAMDALWRERSALRARPPAYALRRSGAAVAAREAGAR